MFKVIQDTRERQPWDFTWHPDCESQEIDTVKTGDYTLVGYEDKICIERKRSVGEIAINLGSKSGPFIKEFERMKGFRRAVIICEFTVDNILEFPVNSGIPKKAWSKLRINGRYIMKKMNMLCEENGVETYYCEDTMSAINKAAEIFASFK